MTAITTRAAKGSALTNAELDANFTNLNSEKAGLADANTWAGAQIHSDQPVSRALFKDCGYPVVDKGNSGTAAQAFDYTEGNVQRVKATGNFTLSLTNWPPTGNLGEMLIKLVADGTLRTITWSTPITWVKSDGSFTTTFSANGVTLQSANDAIDFVYLWTDDAGATVYGKITR